MGQEVVIFSQFQLAGGVELIGRAKDSGYARPHYLLRAADGQFLQVTGLLYHTLVGLQREKNLDRVAEYVSQAEKRQITAEGVRYLIDKKLVPLGIVAGPESVIPTAPRDLFLGLKYRRTIFPQPVVQVLSRIFSPFFLPGIIFLVCAGFLAFTFWMFYVHGVASAIRQTLATPMLFLLIFGLQIASALFHEIGHASGCRYSGGTPGKIGSGIYLVWPAFFTDLTDAYRLSRFGKLRSDFGGVYFNVLFSLLLGGVYFLTHFEPLLVIISVQNVEVLHQLLPFLRLDGYFIVSDLVGIPDLFPRMKPIVLGMFSGKMREATSDLQPWVGWIVTLWVLITVPVLGYFLFELLVHLPGIFLSAWDSARMQTGGVVQSIAHGDYLFTAVDGLQLLFLLIPVMSIVFVLYRLAKRALEWVYGLTRDSWGKKVVLTTGIVIEVFVVAFFLVR